MAPSRHDWKIVDWDVKPQHNQPTLPVSQVNTETNKLFLSASSCIAYKVICDFYLRKNFTVLQK